MIRTEIKLIIVYLTIPNIIITISSIREASNSYIFINKPFRQNKLTINYFNRLMHKTNNNSRKENTSKNDCKQKKDTKLVRNHSKSTSHKTKDHSIKINSKHSKPKQANLYDANLHLKLKQVCTKALKSRTISLSPNKALKGRVKSKNKVNKNQSHESSRAKLRDKYLKKNQLLVGDAYYKQKQLCIQSTQFFPLSQYANQPNNPNFVSECLSSNESFVQSDSKSLFSVPVSYQEWQQNINLKQSRLIPIEQWQNYEALKLRNEQLSNYIEQLENIEKRLINEKNQQQTCLVNQYQAKREELSIQLQELKEKHEKTCFQNSSLQQMFNESQLTIQALRKDNQSLTEKIKQSDSKTIMSIKNTSKIESELLQLKMERTNLNNDLSVAKTKMDYFESKYKQSCHQKQRIKMFAQEVLAMVRILKQKELQ